jgi:hypothetical protein
LQRPLARDIGCAGRFGLDCDGTNR